MTSLFFSNKKHSQSISFSFSVSQFIQRCFCSSADRSRNLSVSAVVFCWMDSLSWLSTVFTLDTLSYEHKPLHTHFPPFSPLSSLKVIEIILFPHSLAYVYTLENIPTQDCCVFLLVFLRKTGGEDALWGWATLSAGGAAAVTASSLFHDGDLHTVTVKQLWNTDRLDTQLQMILNLNGRRIT